MKNNVASPKITALIVAAGKGERFGANMPKQYLPLLGRDTWRWSHACLSSHAAIGDVYCAINPAFADRHADVKTVSGGTSRQETVRLALEQIAEKSAPDYILIHDAARPCISSALVTRVCDAVVSSGAVIPALPVNDTLRRIHADGQTETPPRDGLYTVQTPQAFKFADILSLHQKYKDTRVTDDSALYALDGKNVKTVTGDRTNIKITHPDDFALAEQYLMSARGDIRTGRGYDVHKLIPADGTRKLMLGGIDITHDFTLDGHSDADVVLHAVTDALLGTICDGDIGMHFSPSDARWKNADSAAFLSHAANLITAKDGIIAHIDITIVCEAPKIGPHRDAMRARIADILGLPAGRISVKATTSEGLGFTGRREGIAADAVATVRLPFSVAE